MKARILAHSLIIVGLSSAFTPIQDDLHQAMTKMMEKMKSMKMTGNPDHDFAIMMAEHHQGSIDAAEIVSKTGKDRKIKGLAQSILDKQPGEQKQLRAHKSADDDHSAHAANENTTQTNPVSVHKLNK